MGPCLAQIRRGGTDNFLLDLLHNNPDKLLNQSHFYFLQNSNMAALAAKAVKDQRKKAANQKIEQALNNVNEQRNALTYVAQKHRADSLSSLSTLDSFRPEVNRKIEEKVQKQTQLFFL